MEAAVYDALKKAVGTSTDKIKIGDEEKTALEWATYWEEGVEKTKTANKDLTGQRETWERERKDYKNKLDELTTTKSDLEKKIEELSGKGKKESGEKEELIKSLNAVNDRVAQMEKLREEDQKKVKEANEKALAANQKASEESLRGDLIKELAENKIEGSNADLAVTFILSRKYAESKQDNEGYFKRSFMIEKEGKQLSATIKDMCKWFAESNKSLVSSSGMPGTGTNHSSSGKTTDIGTGSLNETRTRFRSKL